MNTLKAILILSGLIGTPSVIGALVLSYFPGLVLDTKSRNHRLLFVAAGKSYRKSKTE